MYLIIILGLLSIPALEFSFSLSPNIYLSYLNSYLTSIPKVYTRSVIKNRIIVYNNVKLQYSFSLPILV